MYEPLSLPSGKDTFYSESGLVSSCCGCCWCSPWTRRIAIGVICTPFVVLAILLIAAMINAAVVKSPYQQMELKGIDQST